MVSLSVFSALGRHFLPDVHQVTVAKYGLVVRVCALEAACLSFEFLL